MKPEAAEQNPVAHPVAQPVAQLATQEVTQDSITRVLAIGFSLVIIVLLLGGSVEFRSIASIQENAAYLVRQEHITTTLIESLQDEQKTLSEIFYTITGDPDTANPGLISQRLDQVQKNLRSMLDEAAPSGIERAIWNDLLETSRAFGVEARRLLGDRDSPELGSRDLFRSHEQVIYLISRLVAQGFDRISDTEQEIERRAVRFNRESVTLIGTCLLLALVCSIVTARKTNQLFRAMNWQERELARVSWQMLEDQETIARRFSHELHDELGQTLAALKANLAAVPRRAGYDIAAGRQHTAGRRIDPQCAAAVAAAAAHDPRRFRPRRGAQLAVRRFHAAHRNRGGLPVELPFAPARRDRNSLIPHGTGSADERLSALRRY